MKREVSKKVPEAAKKKPSKKAVLSVIEEESPQKGELPADIEKLPMKKISPQDLGIRYKCYKCDTKFYDLGRPEPLCPSCGANQNDDESKAIHKRKRRRRFFTGKTEAHIVAPEENEDLHEAVNESDAEYALDVDDITLEDHEDKEESEE